MTPVAKVAELPFYARRMIRDVTWRTHLAWRFSSGITMRSGPSGAESGLPSLRSVSNITRSVKAGSSSGKAKTARYPSAASTTRYSARLLPRRFSPNGTPASCKTSMRGVPSYVNSLPLWSLALTVRRGNFAISAALSLSGRATSPLTLKATSAAGAVGLFCA